MNVEGTNYSDVVKYELRTLTESSTLPGVEFELIKTVYYFAPEVATIMTEVIDLSSGEVTTTTTLVDFEY